MTDLHSKLAEYIDGGFNSLNVIHSFSSITAEVFVISVVSSEGNL